MEELFPLESSWIVALAAGAVALIMLLQLARLLPAQNIVVIAAGLLAGEALLEFFLAKIGKTKVTGPMWCFLTGSALLWMAVVLSARRAGQFIMRPWRRRKNYGLWLLGISAVLTMVFQGGWPCISNPALVDPQAAALASGVPVEPEGTSDLGAPRKDSAMSETPAEKDSEEILTAPLRVALMAAIRGVGTAILLAGLSPWFIRKRPVPRADGSELAQQPEKQAQQNADEQTSG